MYMNFSEADLWDLYCLTLTADALDLPTPEARIKRRRELRKRILDALDLERERQIRERFDHNWPEVRRS